MPDQVRGETMKIPRVSCLLVKIQHSENLLVQRFPAAMTRCES